MNYNKFENNLVILLKLFNNRPNHLAKYLIENECFTTEFEELILKSDKLNNTLFTDSNDLNFHDHEEMYNYFNEIINEINIEPIEIDPKLSNKLNNQLFNLLNNEKYEDATKLRDYMLKKNIKIII